jgi:hypothetical protein
MTFRSGIKALDQNLFQGKGVPPGNLVEVFGETASGKTALCLAFCRQWIEAGGYAGWVATETRLTEGNTRWAGITGETAERFVVGHQAGEYLGTRLAEAMLTSGVKVVVIDSVASLLGEEPEVPLYRVLSRDIPKLKTLATQEEALILLTNQERRSPNLRTNYEVGSCPALNRLVDAKVRLSLGENLRKYGEHHGVRVHFHLLKNGPDMSRWDRRGRFNLYWKGGLMDLKNVEGGPDGAQAGTPTRGEGENLSHQEGLQHEERGQRGPE